MFQNKNTEVNLRKVELTNQRIVAPFVDNNSLRSQYWNMDGDVMIHGDRYIRLTSDLQHQAGKISARQPIQADSFEMELTFHIHGKGSNGLIADGMAIWFLDQPLPIGDIFGSTNFFNGLGIFVDTFRNGRKGHFPYIGVMRGDGSTPYQKHNDGMDTIIAGCHAKLIVNPDSKETRMRIIHTKKGYLSVDFNYNPHESGEWKNCFTLSDIHLPPVKYLAISAETGEIAENVDIIESKLYALYKPDSDEFIEDVHQLEQLIEQKENSPSNNQKTLGSRKRRSLLRMRKAEERLKEREMLQRLEKYGDADATFPRRAALFVVHKLKYLLYFTGLILVVWVATIVFRVQKQRKRSKYTGLLD